MASGSLKRHRLAVVGECAGVLEQGEEMVGLHALPAPALESEAPAVVANRLGQLGPGFKEGDEIEQVGVRVLDRDVVVEGDERVREPLRGRRGKRSGASAAAGHGWSDVSRASRRRTSGKTVALKTTLPPSRSRRKRELQPLQEAKGVSPCLVLAAAFFERRLTFRRRRRQTGTL